MAGSLSGIRIIEFASLGPGPFAGMMLADHGAEVIRVERPGRLPNAMLDRSRQSIMLDLKSDEGREVAYRLVESADGLIEGYRPGAMERLGLGPEVLLARNPSLVYGRMTGWGQTGPFADLPGHDINYVAATGALHAIGPADGDPVVPLNLLGDFGGGGMLLAFGMVSALLRAGSTGQGQVVDCAMTDGVNLLAGAIRILLDDGLWQDRRGANILDGGAPFYAVYRTACGGHVSIGALEPEFYRELLAALDLTEDPVFRRQMDPAAWPAMKARLAQIFAGRGRDEWCALLQHRPLCFAPVLTLTESAGHPQHAARDAYVEVGPGLQPVAAPRFSATPAAQPRPSPAPGTDTTAILTELGYGDDEISALLTQGVVGTADRNVPAPSISLSTTNS